MKAWEKQVLFLFIGDDEPVYILSQRLMNSFVISEKYDSQLNQMNGIRAREGGRSHELMHSDSFSEWLY